MVYAKVFFDLQWQFADKVTAISGLPLPRVLLEYTNLYIRFGCGRDFQPPHPSGRPISPVCKTPTISEPGPIVST